MGIEPSFEESMQMDMAIYQLSSYDVSNGLIMAPNNAEEMYAIQNKIAKRFNTFKLLIQKSEMSFEEIKRQVVNRCGPYPIKKNTLTSAETVEQVIKESTKVDVYKDKDDLLKKLFEDIFQNSFSNPCIIKVDENLQNEKIDENKKSDDKSRKRKNPKSKKDI